MTQRFFFSSSNEQPARKSGKRVRRHYPRTPAYRLRHNDTPGTGER